MSKEFTRTLKMPDAKEHVNARELKQRIMKSLQKLTGAFQHTRKKKAIFDFIDCMGQVNNPDCLPFYSSDVNPKRKEKTYIFFCFLADLIQAWWKFETDDEAGEESKEETQAVIEAALKRVEDVTEHGLGAYKICGKETGFWLERIEDVKR